MIKIFRDWPSRWFSRQSPAYGSVGLGCACCGSSPYYYYPYYSPPRYQEPPVCPCPGVALPDSLSCTVTSTCSCLNTSFSLSRTFDGNGCSFYTSKIVGCTATGCAGEACYPDLP